LITDILRCRAVALASEDLKYIQLEFDRAYPSLARTRVAPEVVLLFTCGHIPEALREYLAIPLDSHAQVTVESRWK
jgi:hypothetical protein